MSSFIVLNSYVIFRFVEILNELKFLDEHFYKMVKYGTENKYTITLIKNGYSRGVAELLMTNYHDLISFNSNDRVSIRPTIHQKLKEDNVGFLYRHEVSLNVVSDLN